MLEINSQSTKAGNGSNREALGAKVFQDSHNMVQQKIIKKKPMVPTWSVIHTASFSSLVNCRRCSTLGFWMGLASFFNSSKESGFCKFSIKFNCSPIRAN